MQKLLVSFLLLLSLGANGQAVNPLPDSMRRFYAGYRPVSNNPFEGLRVSQDIMRLFQEPTKRDTVKCRAVTVDSSTSVLVLSKAWVIRDYQLLGFGSVVGDTVLSRPLFSKYPRPIKYLHPNKRDSLAVICDFKPIIQEWR